MNSNAAENTNIAEGTDEEPTPAIINILNTSIFEISLEKTQLSAPYKNPKKKEIQTYIKELAGSMLKNHKGQEHRFVSERCEMSTLSNKLITSNFESASRQTAERLHRVERATQEKLQKITTLRKGSLLQSHIELYDETYILFFKIDHAGFLDENFDWKVGLPEKQIAQKSAILKVSDSIIEQIWVGDSNAKISEYWWRDFLELVPLSSPETNTKSAFVAIEKLLISTVKKVSNSDYWTLRNALVSYFRTNQNFQIQSLVDQAFTSYTPDSSEINMQKLIADISALPTKSRFDPQFEIAPNIIKAKIKKQINLADNLELRITGEIKNHDETFDTGEDADGRKFLKIYSEEGYNEFHKQDN
ncbi:MULTISPECIES: nucleoid-associated protein [Pseudomonas]|uniref:nucleoid-associated protein n=1 Tax=Pseudomonas TaxID=286 RepID=UPI0008126F4C|nr:MULTISPECIES: nucleoid-associated protein [Pseudomonas]CRM01651.1 37-kD nucleoid-associated bacterial protein [Pseudomonas sp. 28 E 9]CRM07995.1 37-kD nucleoid-associated bacterial protein [Pseudomonas sp. 28 E 9]